MKLEPKFTVRYDTEEWKGEFICHVADHDVWIVPNDDRPRWPSIVCQHGNDEMDYGSIMVDMFECNLSQKSKENKTTLDAIIDGNKYLTATMVGYSVYKARKAMNEEYV